MCNRKQSVMALRYVVTIINRTCIIALRNVNKQAKLGLIVDWGSKNIVPCEQGNALKSSETQGRLPIYAYNTSGHF